MAKSKKQKFIEFVEELMNPLDINEVDEEIIEYFDSLKSRKDTTGVTENGVAILQYMQATKDDYNNIFKAKDIAEGIDKTSKTVSGSMRKLVTDGYVEKIGQNPVSYSLTDKGLQYN